MSGAHARLPLHGEHGRHERDAGGHDQGKDHGGSKWWTLVAVCLGTFMLLLDITIVNVALPDIQQSLHATFSGLQWVVDAYALSLAALLLTAGSLADMYGRRLFYVIGLVIFTAASLTCGAAGSTLVLQLARALQGVGGAIMFAVSLALLAEAFRGKDRGIAFGVWGAITGLAVAIGPLLGGVLTSGLSWRWIFFVNVPIGVVAVVITMTKVAETRAPHARRPDWAGFVLFTLALSSLVYALIESNERSFTDRLVLGCFAAAAVLLVAFLVVEWRGKHPMFDLTLFTLPTFSGGSIAAFGVSASIFAMLLYLVLYLQDILGYSALATGVRLLVLSGGILATSAIAGRLSSRVPVRLLIGPGLLIVGVGLLLMRGLDATSSWTHLVPGLLVSGLGVGMLNPPLASTAVGVVKPDRAGMASGINSTFRQVGIATGIALLGTLFSNTVRPRSWPGCLPCRDCRAGPADRDRGAVRDHQADDRAAARARQGSRRDDHQGGVRRGTGPHPADRGDHRTCFRSAVPRADSEQGLCGTAGLRSLIIRRAPRPARGSADQPGGLRIIAAPGNVQDRSPMTAHAAVAPGAKAAPDLTVQAAAFVGIHGDMVREGVEQANVLLGAVADFPVEVPDRHTLEEPAALDVRRAVGQLAGPGPCSGRRQPCTDLVVAGLDFPEERIPSCREHVRGRPEGEVPARAQQFPGPPVLHRGIDPVPGGGREHQVEGGPASRPPGLEIGLDDLHVTESGEVMPGRRGQLGSDLHAGDPEATPGKRTGRLAGRAPDLQEAVTGSEVRPKHQLVVQLFRVVRP